jgi:hypothetical protein
LSQLEPDEVPLEEPDDDPELPPVLDPELLPELLPLLDPELLEEAVLSGVPASSTIGDSSGVLAPHASAPNRPDNKKRQLLGSGDLTRRQ